MLCHLRNSTPFLSPLICFCKTIVTSFCKMLQPFWVAAPLMLPVAFGPLKKEEKTQWMRDFWSYYSGNCEFTEAKHGSGKQCNTNRVEILLSVWLGEALHNMHLAELLHDWNHREMNSNGFAQCFGLLHLCWSTKPIIAISHCSPFGSVPVLQTPRTCLWVRPASLLNPPMTFSWGHSF